MNLTQYARIIALLGPAVLLVSLTVASAKAQDSSLGSRFTLRLEGGGGTMFSEYQRDVLGYTQGHYHATARVGYRFVEPLAAQFSVGYWTFPSRLGRGYVTPVSLGLRLDPRVRNVGRVFIDANFAPGRTGDKLRLAIDLGVGFDFRITDYLELGPVFRYVHVVEPSRSLQINSDARYWAAGATITLHLPNRRGPGAVPPTIEGTSPPLPDEASDRDHDGLADPVDDCPEEAETYNGIRDLDGCPEADPGPQATLLEREIRIDNQILFATDSAEIVGTPSYQILDAIVAMLRNHPEIEHLRIEGHTDDRADEVYNLDLSHRRAAAVRSYLIERDVDPHRLSFEGHGERQRLCQGTDPGCRSRNRRVELHIVRPAGIQ